MRPQHFQPKRNSFDSSVNGCRPQQFSKRGAQCPTLFNVSLVLKRYEFKITVHFVAARYNTVCRVLHVEPWRRRPEERLLYVRRTWWEYSWLSHPFRRHCYYSLLIKGLVVFSLFIVDTLDNARTTPSHILTSTVLLIKVWIPENAFVILKSMDGSLETCFT